MVVSRHSHSKRPHSTRWWWARGRKRYKSRACQWRADLCRTSKSRCENGADWASCRGKDETVTWETRPLGCRSWARMCRNSSCAWSRWRRRRWIRISWAIDRQSLNTQLDWPWLAILAWTRQVSLIKHNHKLLSLVFKISWLLFHK